MRFQVVTPLTTKDYCSVGCDIIYLIGELYLRNLMPFRKFGELLHYTVYILEDNRPRFQNIAHVYVYISYIHRSPYNIVITVLMRCSNTQHAIVTRNIPRLLFTHCGFSSQNFVTNQKG